MQRFDFERAKMFQMSSASERSRTKIAPSRMNYARHERSTEIIAVAIDATKAVTRHAMEWALTNVAQSGDIIILLALLPLASPSWKFWKFNSESARREKRRLEEAKRSCQYMMEQLQNLCDTKKVQTNVKIIPGSARGVTTIEAKKVGATWVVLDRYLKREEKSCSEQLDCNLVIVHRFNPKILRLNLKQSPRGTPSPVVSFDSRGAKTDIILGTPASSPEVGTPFTLTDRANSSSTSCSEPSTSPFSSAEPGSCTNSTHGNQSAGVVEKLASSNDARSDHHYGYVSESDSDDSSSVNLKNLQSKFTDHSALRSLQQPRTTTLEGKQSRSSPAKQRFPSNPRLSMSMREGGSRQSLQMIMNPAPSSLNAGVSSPKLILSDLLTSLKRTSSKRSSEIKSSDKKKDRTNPEGFPKEQASVRKAVSLSSHAPMGPPPLCSICQHKAPAFGRPPRAFTFADLQLATGGFSQANFLAEGGFGSVHRGVLPEGQVVAVKQHKLASSQGDVEFCSEVEVLSCAQHRNVVMLIGYCIEDSRRLLVYEFICNRSLDAHLYGGGKALEWQSRQKIAVGAARGLRYLHEECRVGCIVHRDMRPNNILLTHDYEPMVGDFGLARWQPDGELGVETRVIGTFGYLAPEYTQSGQITEKADVYSFGVVLLELVTGRKAIDISRPKGQQCLTEWARPLLRKQANYKLVDPKLGNCYDKDEVSLMLYAASLCICRDPNMRPRMSQVLRILEGELTFDVTSAVYNGQNGNVRPGSEATARRSMSAFSGRNNRITSPKPREDLGRFASSELPHHIGHANNTIGKLSLEELKAAYRDKVSHRRLSHGDALV